MSRQVIVEEHLFICPFSFYLSSRKSKLCVQHCQGLLSCQSRVWGEQKHNQRGVRGRCHHSDSGRHKNNPYLRCSNNVFMWDLIHYILTHGRYSDYLCIVRNYSDYLCIVKNCSDYLCIVKTVVITSVWIMLTWFCDYKLKLKLFEKDVYLFYG